MAVYQITTVGRDGKRQTGRESAESRKSLELKLKSRRLVLVDCREVKAERIPAAVTSAFITQLADLIGSGVVLDRSLQLIADNAEDPKVALLANTLRQGVKRGQSLSQAMAEVGEFDPLLIPLLRAGEMSGQINVILTNLQDHYRRRQKLRREIAASLTYPVILAIACIASIVGLGVYIIPVFKELFENRMDSLPVTTRAIFWFSDALNTYGATVAALFLGGLGLLIFVWRRSATFQHTMDRTFLSIPHLGAFLGKAQSAGILAVLGVLLNNGVPLAAAMELTIGVARNRVVRTGLENALNDVRRGKRVTAALERVVGFPRAALQMVSIGEETGRLAELCARTAVSMEEDVQGRIKSMVALLEPLLILVMGGTVGLVVVSMLLAVYSMSDLG